MEKIIIGKKLSYNDPFVAYEADKDPLALMAALNEAVKVKDKGMGNETLAMIKERLNATQEKAKS